MKGTMITAIILVGMVGIAAIAHKHDQLDKNVSKANKVKTSLETEFRLLAQSKMLPEDYETKCRSVADGAYERDCKDKLVVWKGTITDWKKGYIEVRINDKEWDLHTKKEDPSYDFDPKDFDIGAVIVFSGNLKNRYGFDHDIKNVIVHLITKSAKIAQAERKEAEKRKKEAEKRKAELERQEKLEKAADLAKKWGVTPEAVLLGEKNSLEAALNCKYEVEGKSRTQTKSRGWTYPPINSWRMIDNENVSVWGDALMAQNYFGAWTVVEYQCVMNLATKDLQIIAP